MLENIFTWVCFKGFCSPFSYQAQMFFFVLILLMCSGKTLNQRSAKMFCFFCFFPLLLMWRSDFLVLFSVLGSWFLNFFLMITFCFYDYWFLFCLFFPLTVYFFKAFSLFITCLIASIVFFKRLLLILSFFVCLRLCFSLKHSVAFVLLYISYLCSFCFVSDCLPHPNLFQQRLITFPYLSLPFFLC